MFLQFLPRVLCGVNALYITSNLIFSSVVAKDGGGPPQAARAIRAGKIRGGTSPEKNLFVCFLFFFFFFF